MKAGYLCQASMHYATSRHLQLSMLHLREQGCTHPIDYHQEDYADAIRRHSPDRALDLVMDPLGGADWKKGYALLGEAGSRFVLCCNRAENDEHWQSSAPEWVGKASMSQRHRFLTVRDLDWRWFNAVLVGIGGGDELRRAITRMKPCAEQPPRGFGQFALQHAPPAPDQAQGGLQPRPASANWQICSGWPALPALLSTWESASGSSRRWARRRSRCAGCHSRGRAARSSWVRPGQVSSEW